MKVVGPFNFLEYPVADWCERNLTCHYEEDLSATGGTPRWFEQPTSATLFELLRFPINYQEYTGRKHIYGPSVNDLGGASTIDKYILQSVDNFIPVYYDHTAGDAISGRLGIYMYTIASNSSHDHELASIRAHLKPFLSGSLERSDYYHIVYGHILSSWLS